MKNNKSLVYIIAAMGLIIVALCVYILVSHNKDKAEEAAQVMTESPAVDSGVTEEGASLTEAVKDATDSDEEISDEELSDEEASEDKKNDSSDKASDDKDTGAKNSDGAKPAVYATVTPAGDWESGKQHEFQYDLNLFNYTSDDLKDWEVHIDGFKGGDFDTGWNGEFEIKGDTMIVTAADYNETLPAKSSLNVGFQVKFDDADDGSGDKNAVLYIGGEVLDIAREEPTTASKEEKEEIKKDKPKEETGTPLANHGKLHIEGTDILDKNGDKYQLKGVSTHGIAWFPNYVNKDTFQTFRDDWGANLIRIAMYTAESGGYCTDGNKSDLEKLVDNGVEYATELGMYVIIDWHILSDNSPLMHEDEAVTFFDSMSAKYADYDNVLYEICNEPNGGTTWSDIKEYAEKIIPVIRANDDDAIIIVGTPTWSQDVDIAADDPIDGQENIAYTTHFYAATHKDNIRSKVKTAHDKGLCVFISEFSICDASGNGGVDYDSADDWSALIDDYNLSYAGWNISNKNETSALIDPGCSKLSDWEDDELSETGKWLKSRISGE